LQRQPGLEPENPTVKMSIQFDTDFALVSEGINRLAQTEAFPKPYVPVWDLVEVDASELKIRLLFVPESLYHVRVEFEDGQDVYISFNRRFWKERDDFRTYEGVELYDLHLDGIPVDESDLDFLFEEGIERLEQFVWNQEVAE
jgi:hypothetical protein